MTFIVQGLNIHEAMPLQKLFEKPGVVETRPIAASRPIDTKEGSGSIQGNDCKKDVDRLYRGIDDMPQPDSALMAERIMTSPVVTVARGTSLLAATNLFYERKFRHLPVVSASGDLEGIVSERDVLRFLGGLSGDGESRGKQRLDDHVDRVMQTPVLTATTDTDVRYIARLFVAQRIGAMPIVLDKRLVGIITRSDVLTAVMSNFVLELWA